MRVAEITPRITLSEPKSTWRGVLQDVAQKHDLTIDDLRTKDRRRHIAWPRHEAFDRMYRETRMSLPSIARIFEMDHTSVLYGIWAHRKRKAEGKVT